MGTKTCVRHPDRPAAARCTGCGKDLCLSCTILMPAGQFCSTECRFDRGFKANPVSDSRRVAGGGAAKGALLVFLLLILGILLLHTFGRDHPTWRRWDLIGRLVASVRK